MALLRMASDKVKNIVITWETDDKFSRNEENAVTRSSSSIAPVAISAFISERVMMRKT